MVNEKLAIHQKKWNIMYAPENHEESGRVPEAVEDSYDASSGLQRWELGHAALTLGDRLDASTPC